MALAEITKNLLTTIAENQPKVKQQGYDEGKQEGYDAFWDTIQQNGNREVYYYTFCNTDAYSPHYQMGNWNETNFLPKYPIAPKKCGTAVFFGLEIDNFIEHCEENGIVIDLSQATTITNFYRGLKTKRIPDINAKSATEIGSTFYACTLLEESPDILNGELITNYNSCYDSCSAMTRIPRLWATNVTTYSNSTFSGCVSLSEIDQIEGEIKVNINFKWSPLSIASLKNIITHLKDFSNDIANHYKYTLTLKTEAFDALDISGELPPSGNFWTEYIDNLKWNLTLA